MLLMFRSSSASHGSHGSDHQFVAARLRVYPEDVTCMYNVLACTGFQNLPCAHMQAVLAAAADDAGAGKINVLLYMLVVLVV